LLVKGISRSKGGNAQSPAAGEKHPNAQGKIDSAFAQNEGKRKKSATPNQGGGRESETRGERGPKFRCIGEGNPRWTQWFRRVG